MAWRETQQACRLAARKLAAIEDGFEHGSRPGRQRLQARFLFGPDENPGTQAIGLHERFHEGDLIDACLQEEPRKGGERFLAEIAAAVEIVAARQVAFGEMTL